MTRTELFVLSRTFINQGQHPIGLTKLTRLGITVNPFYQGFSKTFLKTVIALVEKTVVQHVECNPRWVASAAKPLVDFMRVVNDIEL